MSEPDPDDGFEIVFSRPMLPDFTAPPQPARAITRAEFYERFPDPNRMTEPPMIAYWKGRPIHELPQGELHAAVCEIMKERDYWMDKALKGSVRHINDLAKMARAGR